MYRVIRFADDGSLAVDQTYRHLSTAVRMAYRQLHRFKDSHVVLAQTGGLPGMEDKTLGEWFGRERSNP